MNKKHLWKKTAALALALGLTLGATGCNFFVADNVRDLEQVVATVDISDELAKDNSAVAQSLDTLIANGSLSTDIYKRELVSLFLSSGYSYVQQGYSYKDVFTMLMSTLTGQKILTQYAVSHFIEKALSNPELVEVSLDKYIENELGKVSNAKEKALLQAHPEVLTMKYYLTDFGKTDEESMEGYFEAEYGLKYSLNNSLDSAEANYIKESEDEHDHGEARTTPTNANTEKTEYVPMKDGALNYDVYTGRNALDSCGEYEKVDGSTKSTRMKAYNAFLANLQSYGLIAEGENAAYITQLNYYYEELSTTLGQALVNKYYEELAEEAEGSLTKEKVEAEYTALKNSQKNTYENDYTAFESALSTVSDTAFLTYGLDGYGFVYNILLPFSQTQTQAYSAAKSKYEQKDLYKFREDLLANIQAEDLRGSWFCEEEHAHYAYEKNGKYYFFEDNFSNTDKYETIKHYAGNYAFNGTAVKDDDGEWTTTANKEDIDSFIDIFVSYVSETAGIDAAETTYNNDKYSNKSEYALSSYGTYYDAEDEIDYNGFVYAKGNFNLGTVKASEYFYEDSIGYKALSAVNELMFAYSTDTGCLNTYMGYAVNAHKTNFVSEFEYAAQMVVNEGVGAYAVVPSDYGWHIIYCSYVFDGDEVYEGGYIHDDREKEGTFSYLFYEALKSTSATQQSSSVQSAIIKEYEGSVELFTKRYQDLLDIE